MGWGALIGAGASLIGDAMSQSGQSSTNAAMLANQKQMQDWEEKMSDSAMTRRVADLKTAGLNPLLAVGEGGASTPGMSPVSLGNPSASYGNLGGQVSSAIGVGQQAAPAAAAANASSAAAVDSLASANARNVHASKEAGADTAYINQLNAESQTKQVLMASEESRNYAQASLSQASIRVADATLPKIQAEIANLASSTDLQSQQAALSRLVQVMQGLQNEQFNYVMPAVAQSTINAARASSFDLVGLEKAKDAASGTFGTVMPYVERIFNLFHLGANISKSTVSKE